MSEPEFKIQIRRPGEAPVTPQVGGRRPPDLVDGSPQTFDKVARLAQLAESRLSKLAKTDGALKMAELKLEFGVGMEGEAGVPFVAKGKVDAHFTVEILWRTTAAAGGSD